MNLIFLSKNDIIYIIKNCRINSTMQVSKHIYGRVFFMNLDKISKYAEKGNIDKLIGIADGKDIEMAKAAFAALGKIRKDESFNYLVVNLRNSNKEKRLAAIEAMGNIGYARGRTHLSHVADTETDPYIVNAARAAAIKLADAK